MVLVKPAQIGEHPEMGNTEGKACIYKKRLKTVMYVL